MSSTQWKAQNPVRVGTVITIVGAILAYLIGSGFATGQESLQYFASYGLAGSVGALLVTLIIYAFFVPVVLKDAHNLRLKSANDIFTYYGGKYIGKFFGVASPIFLYAIYATMLSGAGAALNEHLGWHTQIGIFAMALAVLVTVILGLNGLVAVVSKLGPIIVALAIIVGAIGIIINPSGITESNTAISNLDVLQAAPNWFISGWIFPGLGLLMLIPFLAGLGRNTHSNREAKVSGLVGATLFVLALAIVAYGILANIENVYDKQIPLLWIAQQVFTEAGGIFTFVLFAGIYTTAVPLLWAAINRIEPNDTSKRSKVIALIGTVLGLALAQVPFASLVNILFPVVGYATQIILVCIIIKQVRNARAQKRGEDIYDVTLEQVKPLSR
jgi:uncharacterized membrane protein YkvI